MTHVWHMPFPAPPPAPEICKFITSIFELHHKVLLLYFLSSCPNPRGSLLMGDGGSHSEGEGADILGTKTSMTHGLCREYFPFSPRSGSCSSPNRHFPHASALHCTYARDRRLHRQHVSTDVTYGHALNFWNLFRR